ncbi:MAG: hypothetical protein ACRCUS_10225 [Anaerovoracaceae bacterium]
MLSQIILSEPVISATRRIIKKISKESRVTIEEIQSALVNEVIKRDALEDEKASEAKRKVVNALKNSK